METRMNVWFVKKYPNDTPDVMGAMGNKIERYFVAYVRDAEASGQKIFQDNASFGKMATSLIKVVENVKKGENVILQNTKFAKELLTQKKEDESAFMVLAGRIITLKIIPPIIGAEKSVIETGFAGRDNMPFPKFLVEMFINQELVGSFHAGNLSFNRSIVSLPAEEGESYYVYEYGVGPFRSGPFYPKGSKSGELYNDALLAVGGQFIYSSGDIKYCLRPVFDSAADLPMIQCFALPDPKSGRADIFYASRSETFYKIEIAGKVNSGQGKFYLGNVAIFGHYPSKYCPIGKFE